MDTYLAIITTVLIVTQIIRVIQNTIQLRRQAKSISYLDDITNEDLRTQKKAYSVIVDYLGKKLNDEMDLDGWEYK